MSEIILTKEASTVLKKLYSQYKKRLRAGTPASDAKEFENAKVIHKELFPDWSFEAVDSACAELLNAKLLGGFRADGYVYRAYLVNAGIAFSQGLGSKNASNFFGRVLELVQAIRSLLPW